MSTNVHANALLLKLNLTGLSKVEKQFVLNEVGLWQNRINSHRLTVKKATNDLSLLLHALHVAHDRYHNIYDTTLYRSDKEYIEIDYFFSEPTSN